MTNIAINSSSQDFIELRFSPTNQEGIAVKASADDFIVLRHNPSNKGPAILLAGIPGPAGPPSLAEWQKTDW